MSDESRLQVTLKHSDSSLALSKTGSGLIARGRRDAVLLAVPCNKCGECKELVFAGCVCANCSDALDKEWATRTATDWVLITNFVSDQQKQRDQRVAEIMQSLKQGIAKAKGEQVHEGSTTPVHVAEAKPRRHIYRKTTYMQMKMRWANQEPPDTLTVDHYHLGPITDEEMTRDKSSPLQVPFIRPATSEEIAAHRDVLRYQVNRDGLEKWGLDDEGQPLDARWDRVTTERALQSASEEIETRLEELGLEYSDAERRELYASRAGANIHVVGNAFILAEQGDADAQLELGKAYDSGLGVPQDYAEAVRWYRRAAEQGKAAGEFALSLAYHLGRGVAKDDAEGFRWLWKAAEHGHARAQTSLGFTYAFGLRGVSQDYVEAMKWYRRAAEQGDAAGECALGDAYENGRDYAEAAKWYRKAAGQGHVNAQEALAMAYYLGRGVPKDYAESFLWRWKAAEQGHARAQFHLGRAYHRGEGVVRDYAEAAKWYRKAAEQGDTEAQLELAIAYDSGEGVARNHAEAAEWYRKAADHYADAQYRLGRLYAQGQGVAQDNVKAYVWISLAAAGYIGDGERRAYSSARDVLAAKMTPQQITEAEGLARSLKENGMQQSFSRH